MKLGSDGARRRGEPTSTHQAVCRRPVRMTVEQRSQDATIQHPLKRFVVRLWHPICYDFFPFGEALDAEPLGVGRATAKALVVRSVGFLEAQHDVWFFFLLAAEGVKPLESVAMVPTMPEDGRSDEPEREQELSTALQPRVDKPRRFKVIFHNDDYTTMEFVVHVLMRFFRKSESEATFIMLSVHHKGFGVAGIYPRDIAETKVSQVSEYARQHGMPLKLSTEPE